MHTVEISMIENGSGSLSTRETEIIYLMSEGKSGKEIAASLHLSVHTVQKHIKNIYRKLQVHNKIEALNKTKWLVVSLHRNRN